MQALESSLVSRLTLVSAPAGLGKTTTVRQWVHSHPELPVAWLSLEAGDNDLSRFLSAVLFALEQAGTPLGEGLGASLRSPEPPPAVAVLNTLLRQVARQPQGCVLVLDDYHVIENSAIHDLVQFLLKHSPPAGPRLHLLINSRGDLPLPVARMRATGELCELREQDLRFTADEATLFYNQVSLLDLAPRDIMTLLARTEGRIFGLQMAALALSSRSDPAKFVAHLAASQRPVLGYLIDEVLAVQMPAMQGFLLETSVLPLVSADLCNAVTGRDDAADMLRHLDAAHLLIGPLDNERAWYRYHPLFAELLRRQLEQMGPRLGCTPRPELHQRASEWFRKQHLPIEAIEQAVDAGDIAHLADLIEADGLGLLDHGALASLLGWMELLPTDLYRDRPWLAVIHCWLLAYSGQIAAADRLLQAAERAAAALGPRQRRRLAGHIAAVRAYATLLGEDHAYVVVLAHSALKQLPTRDLTARAFAFMMLGAAQRQQGSLAASAEAFADAVEANRLAGKSHVALVAKCNLARLQFEQNQLSAAASTYRQTLELAESLSPAGELLPFSGLAFAGYSGVLRERHQLDQARELAQRGVLLCRRWGQQDILNYATVQLARVYLSAGDLDAAAAALRDARESAAQLSTWHAAWVSAFELQLWVAGNDLEAVLRWVDAQQIEPHLRLTYPHREIIISLAMGLLALGRNDEARRVLSALSRVAEKRRWNACWLETLVLQARARAAAGQQQPAQAALIQALQLAEPEDLLDVFVRQAATLQPLLHSVAAESSSTDAFAGRILAAMQPDSTQPPIAAPVDALSEHELEVLRLLAAGLTNQQIAGELGLALGTVKKRISRIYHKLGVSRRSQAIARSRELELIP